MATVSRMFPRQRLRVSDYTIPVAAPERGVWVLAHGYSGAIDRVDESTHAWVTGGLEGPAPAGETVTHLYQRGYLTRLSAEEERGAVVRRIREYYAERRSAGAACTIILSYDCNFRCTYCTQRKTQLKGHEHLADGMSDEVMDSAFRFIEASGDYDVTLFGGEPLMPGNEHRVRRFAAWLRARGGRMFVVSNGHNWRDYEDVLDPGLVSGIQVTIDGPKEVHDRRRVGLEKRETFERILDNVEWAARRGIRISARINTDRKNVDALQQLTEIFRARGLYELGFSCYIAPVQDNGVMKSDPLFDFKEMYQRMLDAHTRACADTAPGSVPFNTDYLPTLRHALRQSLAGAPLPYKYSYCGAYTGLHVLDPHGRMYACWDFVDDPDNQIGVYHPEVRYDVTASERWRGRDRSVLLKECLTCRYVLLHGSGCQAEAFRQTGRYLERNCEDFDYQFELAVLSACDAVDVRHRELEAGPPRRRSLPVVG